VIDTVGTQCLLDACDGKLTVPGAPSSQANSG
jgi:hypothetical protein